MVATARHCLLRRILASHTESSSVLWDSILVGTLYVNWITVRYGIKTSICLNVYFKFPKGLCGPCVCV